MNKRLQLSFIFFSTVILIYSLQITYAQNLTQEDWGYFNSLSLIIKSIILQFAEFPVQNPWFCGGLDLLTNPQQRIFSPLLLLDIIFHPPYSVLITWVLFSILGLFGTYVLLREIQYDRAFAILGSILFINSSWFGLHSAAGHQTFASMQLLPFVLFLFIKMRQSLLYFVYLSGLLSFLILEGDFYTVFYSLLILGSFMVLNLDLTRDVFKKMYQRKILVCVALLGAGLIASPKLLPLFLHIPSIPNFDSFSNFPPMSFKLMYAAFFDIHQKIQNVKVDESQVFKFQEFGLYLSPILILSIFIGFFQKKSLVKYLKFLILTLLWFWVGTAQFPEINPWRVIYSIPLLDRIHSPHRTLIIAYFFFLVLSLKALNEVLKKVESKKYRSYFQFILFSLLMMESFYVRIHSSNSFSIVPFQTKNLIQNTNVNHSLQFMQSPNHFLKINTGTAFCYEPSFTPVSILSSNNPLYKGEIYSVPDRSWEAKMISYTPGRINIAYKKIKPEGIIRLNVNALYEWVVEYGQVELLGQGTQNLDIKPLNDEGQVVLRYKPWYLPFIMFAEIFGVLVMGYLLYRYLRGKKTDDQIAFNYSAFPPGYYHDVMLNGHPVRKAWHQHKFKSVLHMMPKGVGLSVLDIGCFAGSFLSLVDEDTYTRQVGVDVLHKQIEYAQKHLGTSAREFLYIESLGQLDLKGEKFDCITLIEVVEHLHKSEVAQVLDKIKILLKPGGKVIISTPNYFSLWPFIEVSLNLFSDVSYEEQHVTKFSILNFRYKLKKIYPEFDKYFEFDSARTGLFLSPFLAFLSKSFAEKFATRTEGIGKYFPFGNLLFYSFTRKVVLVDVDEDVPVGALATGETG